MAATKDKSFENDDKYVKEIKKPIFRIHNLEIIATSFVNFARTDFAQHPQSFSQSSLLIGIVLCCQCLNLHSMY